MAISKFGEGDGESAGARTQDQRLKRAMLYQLSYALEPHFQGSIAGPKKRLANDAIGHGLRGT